MKCLSLLRFLYLTSDALSPIFHGHACTSFGATAQSFHSLTGFTRIRTGVLLCTGIVKAHVAGKNCDAEVQCIVLIDSDKHLVTAAQFYFGCFPRSPDTQRHTLGTLLFTRLLIHSLFVLIGIRCGS